MTTSSWLDQLAKVIMACLAVAFLFSNKEQRQSHGKSARENITMQQAKELTKQRKYESQLRNQQMNALLNSTGLANLVHSYLPLIIHLLTHSLVDARRLKITRCLFFLLSMIMEITWIPIINASVLRTD